MYRVYFAVIVEGKKTSLNICTKVFMTILPSYNKQICLLIAALLDTAPKVFLGVGPLELM